VDRPDLRRFLAEAKATSPRHWAGSQLLCIMGLRASEACGLTIEQALNVEQGMRVLRYNRKGSKPTATAVPYQSLAAIDAVIGDRTSGMLLTTLDGRPLTRHALYGLMTTVGNRCGFKMNPHYLRAMGATTILESGGSIYDAQHFLDHEDVRTTQRHYDLSKHDVAAHPAHLVGAKLAV
jgi:integrase